MEKKFDEGPPHAALTNIVINEPDQLSEGGWSELEQGFFESAPPDAPGPAPEPLRFDDLDPGSVPVANRPERLQRVRLAASVARSTLRSWSSRLRYRLRPAFAVAGDRSRRVSAAAWRRLGAARRELAARIEEVSDRIIAMVPNGSPDRRAIVATLAALVVTMGLSAVVVAARGAGRPTAPPAAAMVALQEAPGGVVLCAAPVADPEPADPGYSAFEPPGVQPAAAVGPAPAPKRPRPAIKRPVAQRTSPAKLQPIPVAKLPQAKAAPSPAIAAPRPVPAIAAPRPTPAIATARGAGR